ncbi:MAG: hypothetical protein C4527_09175 [Candidatus Omnitrophota bacterium]|nr:MAG: hypothetical protein C4527_09175 [Candidatus Omnitrophota bacterium]
MNLIKKESIDYVNVTRFPPFYTDNLNRLIQMGYRSEPILNHSIRHIKKIARLFCNLQLQANPTLYTNFLSPVTYRLYAHYFYDDGRSIFV